MGQDRRTDTVRDGHIQSMGKDLGDVFDALWREAAWIHVKWRDCKELFSTKPTRVDLMNEAAPLFFRMVEDSLFENILIHITRLTDPPESCGKANLTIKRLPPLISDPKLAAHVEGLIDVATTQAAFCRDWRNRKIAHADLRLALDQTVKPLESATCGKINAALEAVSKVLNSIETHYMASETCFEGFPSDGGSIELLHVIDDGLRFRKERKERRRRGEHLPTDRRRRDL